MYPPFKDVVLRPIWSPVIYNGVGVCEIASDGAKEDERGDGAADGIAVNLEVFSMVSTCVY